MSKQSAALFDYAFTWSLPVNDRVLSKIELFKAAQPNVHDICKLLGKKFVYQLECTDNNNYHYQGYISLKVKSRVGTIGKAFSSHLSGCHLSICSDAGKLALQKYCLKAETRVAGPWADRSLEEFEEEEEYKGADLYSVPYPWQQQLEDHLKDKCDSKDDRKIIWLYDPQGAGGKTKFIKKMAWKYHSTPCSYGRTTDILNLVSKVKRKRCFLFNLTRAKPMEIGSQDLYSTLESIKDGLVVNTKYETKSQIFDPPHIVVFANHLPNLSHMSADRWDVRQLHPDHCMRVYVPPVSPIPTQPEVVGSHGRPEHGLILHRSISYISN